MIINSIGNTKITIGETQEYKTTIDIENLDFIATLLSSNLYSNPEDSFIREIVSNGWDSHVAAGTTDIPIIIKCKGESWDSYNITIRDYGTGLSKEDFEKLYCKIGSSTKRDSNNYIGCFGLGHLSPLSVSKVVYITSYYNGVARFYIMTKDGNSITTNLISEQPTTEKNGLEITVKNINNKYLYKEAILKLVFFPNIYVEGVGADLNQTKIKKYKNFSVASIEVKDKILLGNVLYPLKEEILPLELERPYKLLRNSGVVFNFNIGELAVTPNRESIIYNANTENLIIKRIQEAFAEISQIIIANYNIDLDNPYTYYDLCCTDFEYDFFENSLITNRRWRYNPGFNNTYLKIPFTLKGKSVNIKHNYRRSITARPNLRGVIGRDKVWVNKFPWEANQILKLFEASIIIVDSNKKLSGHLKNYLLDNYPNSIICNTFDYNDFLKAFATFMYIEPANITQDTDLSYITKCCYEWLLKKCITTDFETDPAFIEYKETKKKESKENKTVNLKKIILTVYKPNSNYPHKIVRYDYKSTIEYIKGLKTGVLFRNLDKMYISEIAGKLGYTTIGANKEVVELLQKENLKCAITENTILNHPDLIFLKSAKNDFINKIISDYDFKRTLPIEFQNFLYTYDRILKNVSYFGLNTFLDKNDIPIDEDIFNMSNTIKECYISYDNIIKTFSTTDCGDLYRDAISYVIMKNKLYRIGYMCYKTIKENKLLTLLCTK